MAKSIKKQIRAQDKLAKKLNQLLEKSFAPDQIADILSRHRSAAENKDRLIIEHTSDAISTATLSERPVFTYVSPSLLRGLGYKAEEVIGKSCLKLVHSEDRKRLRAILRMYIEAVDKKVFKKMPPSETVEYRIRDKQGNWKYVQSTVNILDNELLMVSRDITRHKKADEKLRESEERFRKIAETAGDAILIHDLTGNIRYVNRLMTGISGYSEKKLLKMNVKDFVPPDQLGALHERQKKRKKGDTDTTFYETGFLRRDGVRVPIEISSSVFSVQKEPRVLLMIRDITQRRQLEQKVIESQKMDSIGSLAGGVAHDFNNMLGIILGYVTFLQDEEKDKTRAGYLQAIERAVNRATELTQKLLAFGGRGKNLVESVNVNAVCREVFDILRYSLDKSIKLKKHLERGRPAVDGDPTQVNQVVMNLCLNAAEAMPQGGTLIVETRRIKLDAQFCSTRPGLQPGPHVMLSVTDTGTGMSGEQMQRIFEPFYTTKKAGNVKGTGLGLPTVYGIVRNHGGDIAVYSEPGKGTTFIVYLPAGVKKGTVKKPPVKKKPAPGKGTILVVDDEKLFRDMLSRMVRKMGYTVITASDGQNAVDKYKKHRRAVRGVILDMVMPRMNGRDAYLRLKKTNPRVKVLLTSGYAKDGRVQDILDLGVLGFIKKPYRSKELSEKLNQFFSTRK